MGTTVSNYVASATDLNGQFKVTYQPPSLAKNDTRRTMFIYAKATHADYPESRNATITIVVHPPGGKFLIMLVNPLGGDLVEEGRPTLISVKITDQDEDPVYGASVVINSDPPAEITPSNGTTDTNGFINGVENIEFIAPAVEDDKDHLITITAILADHEPTDRNFTMTVAAKVTDTVGDFPWLIVGAGIAVAGVAAGIVAFMMMKGGKRKRRRKIKKLKEE